MPEFPYLARIMEGPKPSFKHEFYFLVCDSGGSPVTPQNCEIQLQLVVDGAPPAALPVPEIGTGGAGKCSIDFTQGSIYRVALTSLDYSTDPAQLRLVSNTIEIDTRTMPAYREPSKPAHYYTFEFRMRRDQPVDDLSASLGETPAAAIANTIAILTNMSAKLATMSRELGEMGQRAGRLASDLKK